MLQSVHLISNSIPGVGHTDGGCLPCLGVSGTAICTLHHPSYRYYNQSRKFKSLSLQSTSRNKATICNATSSNNRRNPHFSRQNKHEFSRSRNRQTEEGDGSDKVEESEMFSSKDGPLLITSSGSSKFQATATPGPREREIVQLFRKVQAQLRERAAAKEERKIDESQKKSKPTETVDSLLKLLRKHSVQEGKKSVRNDSNRDFILDQSDQNGSVPAERNTNTSAERNTNTFGSSSSTKQEKQEIEAPVTTRQEKQEIEAPVTTRPRSNFQRRSPVPQVLPVYSDDKEPIDSVSHTTNFGRKIDQGTLEPELEVEPEAESDFEAAFSDDDVFDDLSDADDEISEIPEDDSGANLPRQADVIHSDLSGMKLTELRALAKSRGLKGFSKLKKHDLVELLSESAI